MFPSSIDKFNRGKIEPVKTNKFQELNVRKRFIFEFCNQGTHSTQLQVLLQTYIEHLRGKVTTEGREINHHGKSKMVSVSPTNLDYDMALVSVQEQNQQIALKKHYEK